jgi:hypothetical protein
MKKMKSKLFAVIILLILTCSFPFGGYAADLTPAYLEGMWLLGDTVKDCNDPDAEYLVVRKNGTFETGRGGRAEITGFWKIIGDAVVLDMVTSPGFFKDIIEEASALQDQYFYLEARMIIFDQKDKSFKAIGLLGEEYRKTKALRCK